MTALEIKVRQLQEIRDQEEYERRRAQDHEACELGDAMNPSCPVGDVPNAGKEKRA